MKDSPATDAPLVAVVGMAGRFPGARNVDEFWRNLRDGVESITPLDDQQLRAAGVSRAELANPNYVRAAAILDDFDRFDAAFFGLSPKDAAIMDPQHRLFLECAWEALENAGWCPDKFDGRIGVYAGSGMNSYLIHNLLTNPALLAETGLFLLKQTGNDKDVLATRVSYQLNLTGPSLAVQTACSTSLVAIHLAAQSLLNLECDMALAGGVTIELPHGRGYIYREREILSRDGHCRAFDAASSGTIFGSGLGLVVLRRLDDARRDGDRIRAVIRGTAINNDGARKVGYLAPSVAGQAEAVAEALAVADVPADSISYIEAHGTGTAVGDPIELAALSQVFRRSTQAKGFCAIGSVKTNIGHLDAAAGVTGFIKAVLALEHRQLPPSLNFVRPNPLIDFANSPFFVNTQLRDWPAAATPRRAGVTALGIGGTNAHVILEEAPAPAAAGASRPWQLLTLSARTPAALAALSRNLADHLTASDVDLADAAYTGHLGRKALRLRRALVCRTVADAAQALDRLSPGVIGDTARETPPPVIFLFPGQGSQYVAMGRELYHHEPEFRAVVDSCAETLRPLLNLDLRTILYPGEDQLAAAARMLDETRLTQPALFVIEFAMAKMLEAWGIRPTAMIGHSIGEFTAACLAGVIELNDALRIVAERGRLMQSPPAGAMTAVPLATEKVLPLLGDQLSIASINADDQCVVAGPEDAIRAFETALGADVRSRRLRVSHAFHSGMMAEILPAFGAFLRQFTFAPPRVPFVSGATGGWFGAADANDPDYWCRQLRNTVRFRDGAAELLKQPDAIFVEVGPGNTLGTLMLRQANFAAGQRVIASMRTRQESSSDVAIALRTLGQLWAAGATIDWRGFHASETRHRVVLPTYPFERQRFWIEPGQPSVALAPQPDGAAKPAEGLFHAVWRRADREPAAGIMPEAGAWLIFRDAQGLGARIGELLRSRNERCYEVVAGPRYERLDERQFQIDPARRADYDDLFAALGKEPKFPDAIVHLWSVVTPEATVAEADDSRDFATMSFDSLLYLSQALGAADLRGTVRLAVVSNSLEQVPGESSLLPERALLAGPCMVVPRELPNVQCRHIDLKLPALAHAPNGTGAARLGEITVELLHELRGPSSASPVVYRNQQRWVRTFEPIPQPAPGVARITLRERGVYLITGGLGGIALTLAESLARAVHARLVLIGRTALPPRETWDARLAAHDPADPVAAKLRQLRDLELAGAEVLTIAADVTDLAAMRQALARARAAFGGLNGVIHGAGVLDDAPFLQKSGSAAARVIAPKLQGTLVLEAALADEKLDFLVLMSSVSSILGPAGQIDYAAANAFLDAFARARTGRHGYPVVAIQWPRWREAGMAADVAPHPAAPVSHPLLLERTVVDNAETIYSTTLNTDRDWIVGEHRLRNGPALFPGSGYIAMIHGALGTSAGDRTLTIKNLYFTAPLAVRTHSDQVLQFTVRKTGRDYRFSARTPDSERSGEWLDCAQGEAAVQTPVSPNRIDLEAIRRKCALRTLSFDAKRQNRIQEKYIAFGPRWQSLKRIDFGSDEALVLVEMPPAFHADFTSYHIHPALLDMATGAAMFLIPEYESLGHLYVPASYGNITLYGELPTKCFSHIIFKRSASADFSLAAFDIEITDESGNLLIQIEDFLLREVRDPAILATSAVKRGGAARPAPLKSMTAAPITDGISNAEGVAAFQRILAAPEPNIVVFPSDFAAVVNQAEPARVRSQKALASFSTAAVTDEVEASLLDWWRELLGAENAGRDDDFFALGGQSLTAVRLLAKIKHTYRVDLDLAVLFKAPTVAKLARLIRQGETPAHYRSIVPIRPTGTTPPLFLIHALGGRVVGYGDLARRLPAEQVVYGIEFALTDTHPEHFRMEHLAANYLAELRRIQPQGPYYLLGFSFGGLMAYEMAQQLCAVGQQVAFLGMLDTWRTGHVRELERSMNPPLRAIRRTKLLLRHARTEVFGSAKTGSILGKLGRRGGQFVTDLLGSGRRGAYNILEWCGLAVPKFLQFSNDINWYAVHRYRFLPYPGRIILFRASEGMGAADDRYGRDLGWGGLATAGVEVHEVTSDHLGILREPSVHELAREIAACLDRCRAAHEDSSTAVSAANAQVADVALSLSK